MATALIGERLTEWRNRNPLRVWRVEGGMSLRAAAGYLDRSFSTVQAWEYGSSEPPLDYLAKRMGLKPEVLTRRWTKWMTERPEV